ncbi:MAG: PilZ domain-containing protein [bacterium]
MSEETGGEQITDEDRRRFERVPFTADVEIVKNCTVWRTQLQDISLKGLLVYEPDQWKQEEGTYEIRIKLSDTYPTGEITMKGKIVHSTAESIGFEQVEITSESLTQLRKLLELNLNPGQIQRELSELIG